MTPGGTNETRLSLNGKDEASLDQAREDQQRLIVEIARRYNVQIHPDNPVFVALAVTELTQEKFIERLEAVLGRTLDDLWALTGRQQDGAKALAEKAIAGGADYVAKTLVAAMEEFREAVKATVAVELAAVRRAGEDVRKDRRTVEWLTAFVLGVVATLVGALAAAWFRGV